MRVFFAVVLVAIGIFLVRCHKTEVSNPSDPSLFGLTVHNTFDLLESTYAVFLTNQHGEVRTFRWLPGKDTAQIWVPGSGLSDRFDCTVVQINPFLAPGTGIRDTTITLTTYTNLFNGANIHLQDPNFLQSTDLFVNFSGVNSIDSIFVPQGLTFVLPQASNNFEGQYRILHTGRIWCRVLIDGESDWRYALFENVSGDAYSVTIDAHSLPKISANPTTVSLPFTTNWQYELDQVFDLDQKQFLQIGDILRAPGGAVPIFDELNVVQPPNLPVTGYRLRVSGYDASQGNVGYACDKYFQTLPAKLQPPNFDIVGASLADNRWVSIQCSGFIDLLSFTRRHTGALKINWEALLSPTNSGAVNYRLPDVPAELGNLFPALKQYDFSSSVEVRAENYETLNAYPQVIARRMLQDDPLWQMKAGYVAKMRVF